MVQANDPVHAGEQILRPERPSAGEHTVVDVLHPNAGDFAEDVEGLEYFLQVQQTNIPVASLLLNDTLQRVGGAAVAAPGVKEDKLDISPSVRHYYHMNLGPQRSISPRFLAGVTTM